MDDDDDDDDDDDASPDQEPVDDRANELDGVHIQQLLALRRGVIRARSHALIGAVLCGFAAAGMVPVTILWARPGFSPIWPGISGLIGVLALVGCVRLARRAGQLNRESRVPVPLPPAPPGGPDFSTLSDGSQQWKNLEDVR